MIRVLLLLSALAMLHSPALGADSSGPITIDKTMLFSGPVVSLMVVEPYPYETWVTISADASEWKICQKGKCSTLHIDADRVWFEGDLEVEESAVGFFEALRTVVGRERCKP